jgi:hypothetical protein
MKDGQGKIVALDFGDACFLPHSFFAFTMATTTNTFGLRVAKHFDYAKSTNVNAMMLASYFLVVMQNNKFGELLSFSSRLN